MMLHYTYNIAELIKVCLIQESKKKTLLTDVSRVELDLHEDGYLLSTKKTIEVRDASGQKYKITIEAI